jgi:hypothetical protein
LRDTAELTEWYERQEKEKHSKYDATCGRMGWTCIPFVVDCYGGLGQEALTLMSTLMKLLLGQQDAWSKRKTEADTWQLLSITVAREIARQVIWGRYAGNDTYPEATNTIHQPYCL